LNFIFNDYNLKVPTQLSSTGLGSVTWQCHISPLP
jgi:hypothetical protein